MKKFDTQRGFTLLELMVVMVLISIIAGWFFLNTNIAGVERHLRLEAERLQALIYMAAEESVLYGREYGLEIAEDGYAFAVLNPDTQIWETPAEMRSLRPRTLPAGMSLELYLENTDVILQVEETEESDEELPQPQIFVLSSGELTPFELRLDSEFSEAFVELEGFVTGSIEYRWNDLY
ncbi:MAG: type II secretion system minor pseudopilin GspH [Pseudomonadota bacterium]